MTGAHIVYDGDLDALRQRQIAVIGYGSQGSAHAQNLRDSGCTVRVGLYEGSRSWERAQGDGFDVAVTSDAAAWADVVALLLPDHLHATVFPSIRDVLDSGDLLMLAHGFSVVYGLIEPPPEIDVALVAPVGPGAELRRTFLEGSGIPAVFAVHQDVSGQAETLALAYAAALGCTRAGAIRSTLREESETDLFGEQAVLVGGLTELIRAGFEIMVGAGYQPELAYFEAIHQVKLIVDLIYRGGVAAMFEHISDTAELGAYLSGPRVVDEHVREKMREVLADIQAGGFARRLLQEFEGGEPVLRQMRQRNAASEMEAIGESLRGMMPWLSREP